MVKHKIAWSDFEQALLGPKGEGQEARSILQKSAVNYEIATVTIVPSMPEHVEYVKVILTKREAVH